MDIHSGCETLNNIQTKEKHEKQKTKLTMHRNFRQSGESNERNLYYSNEPVNSNQTPECTSSCIKRPIVSSIYWPPDNDCLN